MDLGNILGGITQAATAYRTVQNLVDPPSVGDRVAAVIDSTPATTFLDPIASPVANVPVSMRTSRKPCRRRRRRLLTRSDIADIAALKAVLGNGKNFENVLAQAMYRSR